MLILKASLQPCCGPLESFPLPAAQLPTSVISPSGPWTLRAPAPPLPPACFLGQRAPARPRVCQALLPGWGEWPVLPAYLSHALFMQTKEKGVLVSRCDPVGHIHQALLSPSFFFSPSNFRFGLWRGNSNCERATCQDKNHTAGQRGCARGWGLAALRAAAQGGGAIPAWFQILALPFMAVLPHCSVPQFPPLSNGLQGRIQ